MLDISGAYASWNFPFGAGLDVRATDHWLPAAKNGVGLTKKWQEAKMSWQNVLYLHYEMDDMGV